MPKINSYTPGWLSSPSPGYELFTAAQKKGASSQPFSADVFGENSKRTAKSGLRRTIARRGTEVFVAVGKEIRWADLVDLKEAWQEKRDREHGNRKGGRDNMEDDDDYKGYRKIRTTVSDEIKQLIISPYGNFLAILTTHTVHIALLPDRSHLTAADTSTLRPKIFTLGPTSHVTSQPGVVSALWHPLGVNGTCLVTITEDAVVRVWELSVTDKWSFDGPTLTVDLKKLADGTTLDQDFSASVGLNKAFSPDSFEMEVASACFGARDSGGWSPMTLWVAMREGDIYALCPLLPEKWAPPPMLVPSLSISIVAKVGGMEDDSQVSEQSKLLSNQQLAWMSDLDNQDPVVSDTPNGEPSVEIYTRPLKPGKIPRLQGPFEFDLAPETSDDELDALLSDIYFIGPKIDTAGLMSEEDEDLELDEADKEGLSIGVVCLLSSSGRLMVCLDIEGVEAQWLPNTQTKRRKALEAPNPPSLLTFQVLDTLRPEEVYDESWPMFSQDVTSRYSFFITHLFSITFVSLSLWVSRLESELNGNTAEGVDFRMGLLVKGENLTRERLITQNVVNDDHPPPLAATTVLRDPDLGYFLLTATQHGPVAMTFEEPEDVLDIRQSRSRSPTYDSEPESKPLQICAPRPAYEPPQSLKTTSSLPMFLESLRHSKYKRTLQEPIRLSPATLTIFTDAHKILSEETHHLGIAAAEIFRRCEQLQIELREHINRANEVANRVEQVTGDDVDADSSVLGGNEAIEKRIEEVTRRQEDLTVRLERVRKKIGKGRGAILSDREKVWVEEIATLSSKVLPSNALTRKDTEEEEEDGLVLWRRYQNLKSLVGTLLSEVDETSVGDETEKDRTRENTRDFKVPADIRKGKVAHVMTLLEREAALVEGAKSRLERLTLA